MKKISFTILLFFCFLNVFPAHIKGGFFTYKYLGVGINDPSKLRYKITLTVYMICDPSSGQLTNPINFTIFDGSSSTQIANPSVSITSQFNLGKAVDEPCISGEQSGCYYTVVIYELNNYELPVTANGYTISYQRCCRINNMDNVVNSGAVGNTWTIRIPGTSSVITDANKNSSPEFPINDTVVVCQNSFFSYSFNATDPDADSLVYSLCSAYSGGGQTTTPSDCKTCTSPNPADFPPYSSVPYISPYFSGEPMGAGVTIDQVTGLISGIAPPITNTGEYVITVCVAELRNGIFFAESRKELHIRVRDCNPLIAKLNPLPTTCDGFNVNFENAVPNPGETEYLWEFGDPASGILNTSPLPTPSHVYTDTGVYIVKLKVTIHGLCSDSTNTLVKVYPGFFPGFKAVAPLCKGAPVQFIDTTKSNYGIPTGWQWNFGDLQTNADTSRLQNPLYTYAAAGPYTVQLIVGNTKGCIDTVSNPININDNSAINLWPHDTLICYIDTLLLHTNATGSFLWSPNYSINSLTDPNPLVSPDTNTTYYVALTNLLGCRSTDSVLVNVKHGVAINAGNDTVICRTDGIALNTISDAISYLWSPPTYLNDNTLKRPLATPLDSIITYHVIGNIGKCESEDFITIRTLPYPPAHAGPDTILCFGASVPLYASGGISYLWAPPTFLSATNIPNPISVSPGTSTRYIVAVSDTVGCLKPAFDTVWVNVDPVVIADAGPIDTSVVLGQPLHLNGTGGVTYLWTPAQWLNDPTIAQPTSLPQDNIVYHLLVKSPGGCEDSDSILVKVYTVIPGMYVPTAFSPNRDSKNETFKPILLGMRSLAYFRVYNRWGELVFYTSVPGKGWDGTFNGNAQDPGTYVWMAEGNTYKDETIQRKGSVVLIR